MSAGIVPFDFETNAVRVVTIDGQPWFVAMDVCRVLEHTNPTKAIASLDDDERGTINPADLKLTFGYSQDDLNVGLAGRSSSGHGGARRLAIVSESGLYALIVRSNKPSAKRFRKWVTAEVLPALRRDGFYDLGGAGAEERAKLEAKRAHHASLPEAHREIADRRAEAVRKVDALVAGGMKIGAAVAEVANAFGMSPRTLWYHRRAVYMVPRRDHSAALGPQWAGERPQTRLPCHPEAERMFLGLVARGQRISPSYRRMVEAAAANGWAPVPSEATLRRHAARMLGQAQAQRVLAQ